MSVNMSETRKLFMVSHTHWDPEWYSTYQEYRIRLVKLMDKLLHILKTDPEYKHFMLDGQVSMVEDYLEIRPEKEDEICEFVKSGRLLIGPWYILPEEFMLSPESHIRNLQFGHEVGEKLGGVMKISYLCDMPGHISQLPQILRGFGIDSVCAWRGVQGYPDTQKSEFTWKSPDGSEVLMISMISGYNNLWSLPLDESRALEKLERLGNDLSKHATTRNVLIMDGDDHREPVAEIPSLIRALNGKIENTELIHSSLPAYLDAVRKDNPDLAVYQGELRAARNAFIFTSGIFATRMSLKLANSESENLLESWAEPFSAFSWLLGSDYPQDLLRQSWKYQLSNNFHDVIYGGHVDGVTADAMSRYKASREISTWLTQEAMYYISQNIGTAGAENSIVVFNPCGWANTEVINFDFYAKPEFKGNLIISDEQTEPIPFQVNHSELVHKFTSDKGLTDAKIWRQPGTARRKISLSLLADNIPALGYRRFSVTFDKSGKTEQPVSALKIGERECENEHLRMEIESNGTLNITDKASGATYKGLNYFEDSGDVGDHYFFSSPADNRIVTTLDEKAVIKLVKRGPVEAVYKISMKLKLPRTSSEKGRSGNSAICPITSYVSLRLGSKRVDITTVVDNKAENHRLRAAFPTGIHSDTCYVGGHFDVVEREISPAQQEGWWEQPSGIGPQRLFMSMSDGNKGITLINKGVPQYEADSGGTVYMTLLRSVSHLAKYYMPQWRTGGMDFPVLATPAAQEPGEHTFHYSIYPHKGNWQSAESHLQAISFNAGMRAMQTGSHGGELPNRLGFVNVSPSELVVSAVNRSKNGDGLIVRFYNSSEKSITGSISLFHEFKQVDKVNLLEDAVEQDTVTRIDDRSLKITANPYEIVTLKFVF